MLDCDKDHSCDRILQNEEERVQQIEQDLLNDRLTVISVFFMI